MSQTTDRSDILVCGGGPAGLAVTAALADRGLDVGCVAPTHPPSWPNTYGCWRDELSALDLEGAIDTEWRRTRVRTDANSSTALNRTYVLIDNAELRGGLVDRAESHGATWYEGRVERVARLDDGLRLFGTRRGESTEWGADLVIDATGHDPVLCDLHDRPHVGVQKAWGAVVTCRGRPISEGSMALMDWTSPGVDDVGSPTFLYAMQLGDDRWFVEETVLVDDSPPSFDVLRDALRARLDRRNVEIDAIESTERVEFPMGRARPSPSDRLVPFGAAAGLTHPATGYSVARTLRAAGPVADAIAEAHEPAEPAAARRAADGAFQRMWSDDQRRAHDLLTFGARVLNDLDRQALARFFRTFFELPDGHWRDYLAGDTDGDRVAHVMLQLFRRLPWSLRGAIARRAASTAGVELARGATTLLGTRRRGRHA